MILFDRHLLIVFSTLLAIILPILTITTGNFLWAFFIIILLIGHKLLNPSRLYILALVFASINLKAPIGRFMMSDLIYILAIIIILLQLTIVERKKIFGRTYLDKVIVFFGLNLITIMCFRGTGLLIFGDTKIGGGAYILWFVVLAALYFSKYINITFKQAKILIICWTTLPLINPLFEWLTYMTGGSIYFFTKYFDISFGQIYQRLVENNTDMARTGTMPISLFFQIISLLILSRKQNLFIFFLLTIFGAIAILFSGFRSFLVAYLMINFISAYFLYKKRGQILIFGLPILIFSFTILSLFKYNLPFAIQRAISFIPGLKVDGIAMENALDTTIWRINIWKRALSDFSNHAIIGRGLSWDTSSWTNLIGREIYGSPEFFYVNHNYHSGPITAFVDYGIVGALLWLTIQFIIIRFLNTSFKPALKIASNSMICSFYIYGCIFIYWHIFHFWFIYGSTASMQRSVSYFILMIIIKNVVDKIIQKRTVNI